ncbi:type VI secretion system contractile sheath small subunit [Halarcobacter anaerophilus]|jgi:type VI secretion system protein ImpB|uniref:Type VI secretion system contractile sheath small subunit n=1 Tax=Halarcobacter anaerophilus TaxID=877500 RepID=A0A4Q0XUY4_9BACT|nr:type VI secretion system contractile sheath small subunit [Halarcobacter anaerophilus]QDF28478.1 type VI secretion system, tubular sheath protein [Halarcobacter anaerophilus]RXJ61296.1 type VI secretion system contractile sheath small subunit [Halarcobacter anaerophilus]
MEKQSESPKERINVTYKPATGDALEDVEIPYKLTILGEYNPNEEKVPVEEKRAVKIDKSNFNDVLKAQNLSVNFNVDNKLIDEEDSSLNVNLKINTVKDFSPEKIVENVPEMKVLMQLRQSLMALKGPLGNVPAFRKAIEKAISNKEERDKLMEELSLSSKE